MEAGRRLQEFCRAFVPAPVGAKLIRGLRDALPAARALLVPDDAPSQLEGCRAALAASACRRGLLVRALYVRSTRHAWPRRGPDPRRDSLARGAPPPPRRPRRVPAPRRGHKPLSSFDSASSSASSADSLVEMASCSDSNGASRDDDSDEGAADGNADGPAAAQDRECALLLSSMRGGGK